MKASDRRRLDGVGVVICAPDARDRKDSELAKKETATAPGTEKETELSSTPPSRLFSTEERRLDDGSTVLRRDDRTWVMGIL